MVGPLSGYRQRAIACAMLAFSWLAALPVFVPAAPAGLGDVNGDGAVDLEDASLLASQITGSAQLTTDALFRANANQDSSIDVADIIWAMAHPSITITLPGGVPLELVCIPAGTFQMGSADTERSRDSDEGPVHTVTISRCFYMGRTEVTQQQWLAVMGGWPDPGLYPGNPTYPYGVGASYPAYFISWNDVTGPGGFLEKMNQHLANTGQGPLMVRLPTEAEWEYACRATTKPRFFFGDSLTVGNDCEDGPAGILPGNRSDYMWYCGDNGASGTADYGSKPVATRWANQFGLYDMSGNVWEWTQEWYGAYSSLAQSDPTGPASGSFRVFRGGDWGYYAGGCRSANRSYGFPGGRFYNIGFRLASPVQ